MGKMRAFLGSIRRLWYMKYLVVVVLGVLFVGFLDDNSLWAHMRNKQRIAELNEEIERYDKAYQRDQSQIRALQRSPKAIEKIARERYFMKADDEDIFVLSDDLEEPKTPATDNETAQ